MGTRIFSGTLPEHCFRANAGQRFVRGCPGAFVCSGLFAGTSPAQRATCLWLPNIGPIEKAFLTEAVTVAGGDDDMVDYLYIEQLGGMCQLAGDLPILFAG